MKISLLLFSFVYFNYAYAGKILEESAIVVERFSKSGSTRSSNINDRSSLNLEIPSDFQCTDSEVEVTNRLPPVKDQAGTNWCVTFTSSALLEELHYRDTGEILPLSIIDIKAHSKANLNRETQEFELRLQRSGDIPGQALGGVRLRGSVLPESVLPFQNAVKTNQANERALERFFKSNIREVHETFDANCNAIYSINGGDLTIDETTYNFLQNFRNINNHLAESIEDEKISYYDPDFTMIDFDEYKNQQNILTIESTEDLRIKLPPYNVVNIGDEGISSMLNGLRENFSQGRPIATGICGYKLKEVVDHEVNNRADSCGPHGVTLVGMRPHNGQCQILIRNSWGADWGGSDGAPEGHAWISIEDFLYVNSGSGSEAYYLETVPEE